MAAYFEQVKKQPYNKTPLGETGCLNNFLGYLSMSRALHRGFSDLKRSPSALSTTPTAFGCLLLLIVPAPSFLIHPLFLTQSFRVPLVIYPSLCSAYVTYRMPCHVNGHQANSYLGTRKISLGVAIILSICLCLYTYNHS